MQDLGTGETECKTINTSGKSDIEYSFELFNAWYNEQISDTTCLLNAFYTKYVVSSPTCKFFSDEILIEFEKRYIPINKRSQYIHDHLNIPIGHVYRLTITHIIRYGVFIRYTEIDIPYYLLEDKGLIHELSSYG